MPDTTVSAELQGKDGATVRTVEIGGAAGDFGVNRTGAAKEATLAALLTELGQKLEPSDLAALATEATQLAAATGTLRTGKRYDIRPDAIYLGTAALGSNDAQAVWTIKRVTLASGSPTHTHWSAAGVRWTDRETTAYT